MLHEWVVCFVVFVLAFVIGVAITFLCCGPDLGVCVLFARVCCVVRVWRILYKSLN